ILDCPLSTWAEEVEGQGSLVELTEATQAVPEYEVLKRRREIIAEDVIVMTQACDLEYDKVTEVVLCPHYALSFFRNQVWAPDQERKKQKTSSEAWQKYLKAMVNGHLWNLCVLNSSSIEGREMEHRVVD